MQGRVGLISGFLIGVLLSFTVLAALFLTPPMVIAVGVTASLLFGFIMIAVIAAVAK